MAIKDCLYTLEDHPELLDAFKADLAEGTNSFPSYIKTVMKNLQADKRDVQLNALGIKRGIGHIESSVKRMVKEGVNADDAYKRAISTIVATSYKLGKYKGGMTSIEAESAAFRSYFHSKIAKMMSDYQPRKFGFEHSREAQEQLVRGLYGSTTDVDAKVYAQGVADTLEEVRQVRNAYGGRVEKLDTYRLPQTTSPVRAEKAGFEAWKDMVLDTVDPEELKKQVQYATGQSPSKTPSADTINLVLKRMHKSIITDGASEIRPRGDISGLRGNVSKRHTEHRFLHFKDADSWLKYNKEFGSETPYAAITNHIDQMSREIASMKILGANPEKNLTYLMSYVDKRLEKRGSSADAHTLYKVVMGELDGIPHPKIATAVSDIRNIMAGTKLGSATLSAMSDNFFLGRMAMMTEIPVYKMYTRLFKQLKPGSEADRVFAGQIGMSMDYAVDKLAAINRIDMTTNNNWSAKFADSALRMAGLNYWTQAVEYTFKLEFAQNLGNKVQKSFDDLGSLKEILSAYGITKKDWGVLRNTPLASHKGSEYFDVTAIKDINLMAKVQGMILSETAMAAPRPTARVQAFMYGGESATSAMGMVRRAFFQFKGFPVSILMNQWSREWSRNAAGSRMLGLGGLIVGTTILGAMSYNLKEISKGKTPLDWDSKELMWNGLIQGGSLGLIGDVMFLDPDKPGSYYEFLAGPMAGEIGAFVRDIVHKPMADVIEMNGKATETLAKGVSKFARRNVPAPLNLPVIKTAFQRATLDQIDKQVDPKWRTNQRRLKKEMKKKDQSWWWKPGDVSP